MSHTAHDVASTLLYEAACGLYVIAELTDAEIQAAIDTLGADCSVAGVRALL